MQLEINKLINSEYEILQKLGWLFYDKDDLENGLSKEDIYKLLEIFNEEEMDLIYQHAYDEGFNDGVCG